MKKLLFTFSLLISSVIYAADPYVPVQGDMNPFAYDLSASLNQETRQLNVNYKLNAPALSVTVRIFNGNIEEKAQVFSNPADRRTGAHTVSVDVSNCSTNANLTWRIDVEGIAHGEAKFVNNSNKLYYPTSIDIDNNPQNANFGTVFCIEGRQDGEAGYISSINNDHAGLYVFNADGTKRRLPRKSIDGFGLEGVNDVERYGWNGGKTHTLKAETDANGNTIAENVTFNQNNFYFGDNKTTRGFSPYRVRVSDDGRIFITSLTPSGDVLYEADKNVFSDKTGDYWNNRYWYRVISKYENDGKTLNSSLKQKTSKNDGIGTCRCGWDYCHIYNLYTINNEFVAGPNVGFDVRGGGNNLQLLMLSGCKQAIVHFTPSRYYCSEYDLGTNQVWNNKPSDRYEFAHVLTHNTAQVQYDKNGNVWMCQYRENAGSTVTLMRYNVSTREIDFQKTRSFLRCGAIRFNNDFTKLAVATRLGANGSGGAITIYDLDQNGLPIGDGVEFIVGDKIGVTMMDFAWDYANNLYIAADYASTSVPDAYKGKGRCIGIYAMPNNGAGENIVSTPAKTGFRIECLSGTNYSITANSNNIEWGTVNMTCSESLVSGKVPSCAKVTVSATPTEHHRFVEWKVGGQTVSTNATYSFYATKNLTITAHFASARHKVTWHNLFMKGKDIDTDNLHYPNINERLWRMFQARYKSHLSKYNAYTSISDYNLDNRTYVRTDNLFLVDLNNDELVKASTDVQDFLSDDETFRWLKDYILSNNPNKQIGTDKAYVYHLFGFFNRTNKIYYNSTTAISNYEFEADYEELGKPEHWASIWTEKILGLPQTMAFGEYTPISWDYEEDYNKCLFRGRWVSGWNDQTDNTGECIIQRPDAWYISNSIGHYPNDGPKNETHILAWRNGSTTGDIVTMITGDVNLYATYVEKNIDEYDAVPANPANHDASNNDVIRLLQNPNYQGSHELTVSRQLQGGMYNTICLPFNVDLSTLANGHPLKDAKLMRFTGLESLYNEANERVTVLQFTETTTIEKGVPYLIQTQSDVVGKTSFSGITYNTITPDVQQVTPNESPFTFHGSINPTEVPEGSLIVVANNRLALTTEDGEMAGMRGYFSIDPVYASEIAEQAAAGRVYLNFQKPTTTSIPVAPEAEQQSQPQVYKLLQDGNIYIIRGNEKYDLMGRLRSKQ